jgi:hypothetical protein
MLAQDVRLRATASEGQSTMPSVYVEEIHRIREKLLAQFDNDLGRYVDHLIEEQDKDRDRLVTREEALRRKHHKPQ